MKGLLLNVMESKVEIVQANGLKDYYRLIGCSTIDIVKRRIAGEANEDGNLTDLSDTDIVYIRENIHLMETRHYPGGYTMLCQVEY